MARRGQYESIMPANIGYLIPRLIRRLTPDRLRRWLMDSGLISGPGLETSAPEAALARCLNALEANRFSLVGKTVLLFGYGGSFATACALLDSGACRVTLFDRFAQPYVRRNRSLWPLYDRYLEKTDWGVKPRKEFLSVLPGDAGAEDMPRVDIVLSGAVLEHVADLEDVMGTLVACTSPGSIQLHFVDLRDHFFKYPFEMLCYSDDVWRRYLNPPSNLNRLRLRDYERVFKKYFSGVSLTVLERDPAAFEKARPRILEEFLTRDPQIDSVTRIQAVLEN